MTDAGKRAGGTPPPADDPRDLSPSVEDYLKAIYALSEEGAGASTSAIAESLEIQPGSVSGMVKRLAETGFAEHVPYRGVRLSAEGKREALRIIRRHRVIEAFLVDHLGYTWDNVHDEAERLEHAASDELVERMAGALEDPRRDPHGAPIPTPAGEIEATDYRTLAEVDPGSEVELRLVHDDDSERLRYLASLGLELGARIYVAEGQSVGGPVRVEVGGAGGTSRVIGAELAGRIFVAESD